MQLKNLSLENLSLLAEIDRAERVNATYSVVQGRLAANSENIEVPAWHTEHDGNHSVAGIVDFAKKHVAAGAQAIGLFSGDNKIAGMGIISCNIKPATAQIALLYVDRSCRRAGVATELMKRMEEIALEASEKYLYVSATPTESAVNFYLSWGFRLAQNPIKHLFDLEPEDIHMIKNI